jgi:hypothetical protein
MSGEATENSGAAENNEFYADTGSKIETFDDLDNWDGEDSFIQSGRAGDNEDGSDGEEEAPKSKKDKEQAKKDRGQKGDDLEALDLDVEEDKKEEKPKKKEAKSEEDQEDEEEIAEDSEEKKAEEKSKGKKVYIKVGEETFGIDSNAVVPVIIDGQKVEVPLQELRNEYSGKKYAEKKINEVNLEKQQVVKEREQLKQSLSGYKQIADKITKIASDVEANPKEAFKIFVDAFGFDSYDLEERMFKHDLAEFSNLIQMSDVERKAYLLEKKSSHQQALLEKRNKEFAESQRVTSYTQKVDQLRKSMGVSEAQYVDAFEELTSKGLTSEQLTEQDIMEWAATKPHRATVESLLEPYEDEISDEVYGELNWTLAQYLLKGQVTKEDISKHLQDVYGVPTEIKNLNEKFKPVGRKSQPGAKQSTVPPKKYAYESFDDLDDE